MIHRYLGGCFPDDAVDLPTPLLLDFYNYAHRWRKAIENYELSVACDIVWEYVRRANRLIEERAPWKLAKDSAKKDELTGVLYDLASVISGVAVLLFPYMPESARKIWKAFGNDGDVSEPLFGSPDGTDITLLAARGVTIEKIDALFPRIEEKKPVTEEQKETPSPSEETDQKPVIEFDDFMKLDLRVGTVLSAEKVEGSKKLLRLKIDDGMGGRQILAGLAEFIEPETVIGKQVVFVANLKPRKMMGELSQGMVLAAESGAGFSVLSPVGTVLPGAKVS